ncbi:MAG TPA: malto-oligosyltrehalose trehalohydrolase [Bryobacteraceae bacterium]|nr:malto-oligosyltrehalose trehalohydrolase [Bryobacteraceae bacterium]
MTGIRVWAPNARRVRILTGGQESEMAKLDGGWWSAETPIPADADYAFRLDDDRTPLPDPRSPWQPYGVDGPSRRVDHAAFRWSDGEWQAPPFSSAVIYELHIGTFTPEGTFDSAIHRLAHLSSLGVTHVELMPVPEFSGDWGWGYDGVDLYAPHHAYGGPLGLKRFVDACHSRGIAVLLDVVYNHLGPAGNYLSRFGPYFTKKYLTPWGEAMNLDGAGSRQVRRFLCDNALMWLRDYHIDGLRLDAIHAIYDSSAVHFLEQLAQEVEELETQTGRRLVLVAESDLNDPRVVTPIEEGGYGIDAQWNDDFHHALHTALTGECTGYYRDFAGLRDLAKSLQSAFVYDGHYSDFRGRHHGRKPHGIAGTRFVGFLQNHDQAGNRARGERTGHYMNLSQLQIGAALVLCSPFVPLLFQGEEFGASTPFCYFTQHADPELARAVTEGRRAEFAALGWNTGEIPDPQDPDTFLRSKLDWNEPACEPHKSLLEWHRNLISLRKEIPALRDGRLEDVGVQFDDEKRWLVVKRGPVAIACNLAESKQSIPLPFEGVVLLASKEGGSRGSAVDLPGESVMIVADAQNTERINR